MIVVILLILSAKFLGPVSVTTVKVTNSNLENVAQLASSSHVYGTELVLLENAYQQQPSYRFEDFFWTGSGDDDEDDDNGFPDDVGTTLSSFTTVYQTTTVMSTVYISETPPTLPPYNNNNNNSSNNESAIETTTIIKCFFINCNTTTTLTTPMDEITPTPTLDPVHQQDTTSYSNDNDDDVSFLNVDRQFWLLTVLNSVGGKIPVIIDLKNSLAKLYETAFQRQQDKHLGIIAVSRKKRKKRNNQMDKAVKVHIHNVAKSEIENGNENIQVLYHVSVAGKPVVAITAAEDMTLVSDQEVVHELGFPFLIKAEPYLKTAETTPQSLSKAKNTWIFIGVSIIVLLFLLLVVAFLTLGLNKCNKKATPSSAVVAATATSSSSAIVGLANRQQIFERGAIAYDNSGFLQQENKSTPTYVNFSKDNNNQLLLNGGDTPAVIKRSSIQQQYSSRSSSSTSLDNIISSPLVIDERKKKQQRTPPKKPPRPRAVLNRTAPLITTARIAPELYDSDNSIKSNYSPPTTHYDQRLISPKSYLSMPSVKSFPRNNMPEPLNKVLEPVSVLHLDMPDDDDDDDLNSRRAASSSVAGLLRYGSVGTVHDPGVIGPIVWNMHCQRLQHGVSVDEGINDLKTGTNNNNVTKMRKRFHELLDDTFSLFSGGGGSRQSSPILPTSTQSDSYRDYPKKSHSSATTNDRCKNDVKEIVRPKTTDLRHVNRSSSSTINPGGQPRGAWSSAAPSPLIRPLSAGVVPVGGGHMLPEGEGGSRFRSHDPAASLIATIKSEIEKCSLPGSTADLHNY